MSRRNDRLKSLDEFEPLAWHEQRRAPLWTVPMILALVGVIAAGIMIGLLV